MSIAIEKIMQDILSDLDNITPQKLKEYADEAFQQYQQIKEMHQSEEHPETLDENNLEDLSEALES